MISVSDIKYDRALLLTEDLTDLKNNMSANGQKQPILLDENMRLIDGLRRLHAWQTLGYNQISAVVSDNLEDTCALLSKVRLHGASYAKGITAHPVTPRRTWELFNDTHVQQKERGAELRKRRIGVPRSAPPIEPSLRSRAMFCQALGIGGEAQLAASALLYKAFTENKDPARAAGLKDIQDRLEAGEMSLYEARGAVDRLGKGDFNGDILTVDAQRSALATSLSGLSGVTKGLTRIGEINSEFTEVELQMYLKQFEQGRRDLQRFINSFRKKAIQK